MSDPSFDANIYPQSGPNPTIAHADPRRADVGVCFSGGGSRALTCAWGQMIGMRSLSDGGGNLLDKVRHISSVSGGTWASVLYTYLPDSVGEDEFFPDLFAPNKLFLSGAPAGAMDVSQMSEQAMGVVPQKFANLVDLNPFDNIIVDFIKIVVLKRLEFSESLKWLWMFVVGNDVLAPFGLYTYQYRLFGRGTPWHYPDAKHFSLTREYANQRIFDKPAHPRPHDFVFVRTDEDGGSVRPMLTVNTNIIAAAPAGVELTQPLQIPVQVTPVSGGSFGANPLVPEDPVGGGSVESFAYTSLLQSKQSDSEVTADFPRAYSLVDITSVSSAFFAATLAESLRELMESMMEMEDDRLHGLFGDVIEHLSGDEEEEEEEGSPGLLGRLRDRAEDLVERGESLVERSLLGSRIRRRLREIKDECDHLELSDLVPQYNVWPVAAAGDGPAANQPTQFTDGGNLENTGVLGMLAQTDVSKIIAFVNTSVELEKTAAGVIVAVAQASPLFGIAFNSDANEFAEYLPGGVNPFSNEVDPTGFLQVFDNTGDKFGELREALFAANGSGDKTSPAFFQQTLNVIENKLAGVAARDNPVTILWVQNSQVNDWQGQIADDALSAAIANGQRESGDAEFASFPFYNTFKKIHQTAAETNTLAQMWAWCVADDRSPLSAAIKQLF